MRIALKELDRVRALYDQDVIDAETLKGFEDIAFLAAHVCEAPISAMSFIDARTISFKATHGIQLSDGSRNGTFCNVVVTDGKPVVFFDVLKDDEFKFSPVVTGDPHIRFYAGFPIMRQGQAIGVLCVMDTKPRTLTPAQMAAMQALTRLIEDRLESRSTLNALDRTHQQLVSVAGFPANAS